MDAFEREFEREEKATAEAMQRDAFEREVKVVADAKRQAANLARVNLMARNGLLRPSGAIYLDRGNRDAMRSTIDIDGLFGFNRAVDKKDYLDMEKGVWSAVVDYWITKDTSRDYDLVPDNMTMYPMVFERHTWYHCNLLIQRRDHTHPSRTVMFVEVKCEGDCIKGMNYNVMACSILDENNCYNCKVCPTSRDILHPSRGGFTCGSEDGQQIFCYTIPVVTCSSGPTHATTHGLQWRNRLPPQQQQMFWAAAVHSRGSKVSVIMH